MSPVDAGALAIEPAPTPRRRADPARRPALRVVPERRRRLGPLGVLAGAIVFIVALVLVAFQAFLVAGQQQLDTVEVELTEQTERYQEQRLTVAELESPARIVESAEDLGMVPPPGVTYLTPSGAVTAPPPAPGVPGAAGVYADIKPHLEPDQ
jgi:cell division protein FtsL